MPLTAIQVKNAKPTEKARRLFDERGLYPDVSLSDARDKRDVFPG
jgi:hypothetical protein